MNVLFVGNSLTYSNNLPELVKVIATCDGIEMQYRSIAFPDYALVDHWNEGAVIGEINSGAYDFVVVQQGPSSQAEGRAYLLTYGLKLDSLCDRNHAQLASYMVWPAKARSFDFKGVEQSYKLLADSANAIFCPAGSAWLTVWDRYPEFSLYGVDNFHPHYRGSLLAAMVIYGSMMKKKNLDFVAFEKVKKESLLKSDLRILIQAAEQTLEQVGR